MKSLIKLYLICIVLGIIAFPVYAFASSNSGSAVSGEGASSISGWTVSNIKYQFAEDVSFVNGVDFDLDGAAGTVSVKFSSDSTMYNTCTNVYGYHWQCSFSNSVSLANMDEFRVIAVGN